MFSGNIDTRKKLDLCCLFYCYEWHSKREFVNHDELVAKYNLTANHLHYQGITKSIKIYFSSLKSLSQQI